MERTLKSMLFTTLLFIAGNGIAANTAPLPFTGKQSSPVPTMEIGKVKHLSKEEIPPELKAVVEDDIEKSRKGYEEVSEEYFEYLDNYQNYLRVEDDVLPNLKLTLANLARTEFESYKYEGMIPGGPTIPGPWTSVTRVFRSQDGMLVKLTEWDFVADGGAIVIVDEVMNSRVSGVPAFMAVKKSPSGKAVTTLTWATDKKQYTLTAEDDGSVHGARKLNTKKWLVKLAESIPN